MRTPWVTPCRPPRVCAFLQSPTMSKKKDDGEVAEVTEIGPKAAEGENVFAVAHITPYRCL